MGRFLIIMGVIFIIAASIFLVYIITGIDSERYSEYLQDWICESEETFVQHIGGYSYSSDGSYGRSVNWTCQSPNGTEREVSFPVIMIMIGAFLVPFLAGMVMIFVGAAIAGNRAKNRMLQHFNLPATSGNVTLDLRKGSVNYQNMTPEAQQALDNARDQIQSVFGVTSTQANQGSLTQKLKQLDDAYQQGLISKDEFDRTRQAILDAMDD